MEMPEEISFPSEFLKTNMGVFEISIAREEESPVSIDIQKLSRKKKLLEFRCRVEDAILSDYIYGKKNPNSYSRTTRFRPKENLRDIKLWGVPLLPSKGHEGTDIVLAKFLKANDFKVTDAFEMLRKTLIWRKKINADGILEENFPPELENSGFISGTDKTGRPICYNVFGAFKDNNKELSKNRFGTKEDCNEFLRWRIKFVEKGIQNLRLKPGGIDSVLQIADMKDAPAPALKDIRRIAKKTVKMVQDKYPGIISKTIIINIPLWFMAYHALNLRFITQRTKSKFIFVRPSKVTETLIKFIDPENIPVQYGGLKRENDSDFSTEHKALTLNVKGGATKSIQIPVLEGGVTVAWDMTVVGYEVRYTEEFVPDDDCSYKVLVQKEKKMGESVRNSFHVREPGNILLTISNWTFKKKKVFYRFKTKPFVPLYTTSFK